MCYGGWCVVMFRLDPYATNLGKPSASVWKSALNGKKPMNLVQSPTRSWNGAWLVPKVMVPCFTLIHSISQQTATYLCPMLEALEQSKLFD